MSDSRNGLSFMGDMIWMWYSDLRSLSPNLLLATKYYFVDSLSEISSWYVIIKLGSIFCLYYFYDALNLYQHELIFLMTTFEPGSEYFYLSDLRSDPHLVVDADLLSYSAMHSLFGNWQFSQNYCFLNLLSMRKGEWIYHT